MKRWIFAISTFAVVSYLFIKVDFSDFPLKYGKEMIAFRSNPAQHELTRDLNSLSSDCDAAFSGVPVRYYPQVVSRTKLGQFCPFDLEIDPKINKSIKIESSYPMAFSVVASSSVEQLSILLSSIYRSWNFYCIHLDRKASKDFRDYLFRLTSLCLNLVLAPDPLDVKWGQISVIQAALKCFRLSIGSDVRWDYLINLADTDFPLKSNLDLTKYLRKLQGASDIEYRLETDEWKYRYRFSPDLDYDQVKSIASGKKDDLAKTGPPGNASIVKGSFSGAFSRDFVDFLVNNQSSIDFLDWLSDVYIPDEYFWPTMYHSIFKKSRNLSGKARNVSENAVDNPGEPSLPEVSPEGLKTVPRDGPFMIRYTHWANLDPDCTGFYQHGLCVFGTNDLSFLVKRQEFFAHKFNLFRDPMAMQCLSERYRSLYAE